MMSICKDEDKKFVSQAVAYVIKHSHKGIVPLCASLATLLQEQDRLQKQVKVLQDNIRKLKKVKYKKSVSPQQSASPTSISPDVHYTVANMHNTVAHVVHEIEAANQDVKKGFMLESGGILLGSKGFIDGCSCMKCSKAKELHLQCIVPPLHSGDQIIIRGELCGVVKYVGHINSSLHQRNIFVGIQTEEPIGDTDGIICGERYFSCPSKHGMFVNLNDVLCVI